MAYGNALSALADPTRRRVFERLRQGPRPVGVIARGMPVSRPAVSQQVYFIDPHGLGALRRWLDQFWDEALAAFQAEVERGKSEQKDRDR
jgi:hypothetical protein